ncbi:MAG: error-prone DNA polymerase [Inquilinaceae bacterium]
MSTGRVQTPAYAELQVTTNFSFLRGASDAAELVATARNLGLEALAVTDRNSLAGAVRMHSAAKQAGLKLVIGARLDLRDAPSLLAYPTDRAAYGRLSRLLSRGKLRAPKGACHLWLADVAEFAAGMIFIALAEEPDGAVLSRLRKVLSGPLYLAAQCLYRGDDRARLARLARRAETVGMPLIATNDVHYHAPSRRALADVLTCIREKCRIDQAGLRLMANAERHLKDPAAMARLFRGHEAALARTLEIVEACHFSLDELAYEYPEEPVPAGKTPQRHLEDLTWEGAARRFPGGVPDKVRATIDKELSFIARQGYAPYFLTVHDIVQAAEARKILCQGRGSAANSVVCFCLGITAVNPVEVNLLFERFVSAARREPPDIDVDFEHERREEVIQYIYERYGRDRAGLAATVISYRPRSAIREVGKVMGLSEDVTAALAGTVWGSWGTEVDSSRVRSVGIDPEDPVVARSIALADTLIGFPRHLSQHVGGFVLTRTSLEEIVPIGNAAMEDRTFIEWDKDDIDELGILKVDVLALGMLTCLAKGLALLHGHYGRDLALATLPREDARVYDMICRADTVGVFQIESRAQMNMLPRLKPRCYYDLVIEVAIVRPGPIQGDMVHPYLRRREGLETVDYPSPSPEHGPPDELRQVLGKTLGVPLFQEQAMRVAIEAAGFTPEDANHLRRAMATFRRRGIMEDLQRRMVDGMVRRGYDPAFAQRCFDQIKGFGEYGFPESHAASFAHLVYASCWIKHHYPDVFCVALLNSQPMGFYAPAQIVRDAREHGVDVQPPDVNLSAWDCTLTPGGNGRGSVRLGLRMIDGLGEEVGQRIADGRAGGAYVSVEDLWRRAALMPTQLETLAKADAFGTLALDRRQALWRTRAIKTVRPLPLFAAADEAAGEPTVRLPAMRDSEQVVDDYRSLRLSLKGHPMDFLRPAYAARGIRTSRAVAEARHGARLRTAGVVLVRQRPGSSKGVVFVTLEDETGVVNAVVWPALLERFRPVVMGARLMEIEGRVERLAEFDHRGRPSAHGQKPAVPIVHLVADRLIDRSADLARLADQPPVLPLAHADEVKKPVRSPDGARRHPRNVRIIPKSRDFH